MKAMYDILMALVRDAHKDIACDHCGSTVLGRGKFCSNECEKRFSHFQQRLVQWEHVAKSQKATIENLKSGMGVQRLLRDVELMKKLIGSLQEEVNVLRKGCEDVKVLDNPAMRWIHRALRDSDRIRSER